MWLLVLAACGGGGGGTPIDAGHDAAIDAKVDAPGDGNGVDAMIDAGPIAMTHHHYVIDSEQVPTTNSQATAMGFDLNNDGSPDNQFGMVLATLSTMGSDVQAATTLAVDRGRVISLLDVAADDLTTEPHAGFAGFTGSMPVPAACTGSADMVCRGHLQGTASFMIPTGSPTNPPLGGTIATGALAAGPGHLALQLAMFGGGVPPTVTLIGARAQVTGITATGLTQVKIGGAISQTDIDTKIYPALRLGLQNIVARDCSMLGSPPGCGCTANSTGQTLLGLFEITHDCTITLTEVQMNQLMMMLFAPDVTVEGQGALSYGFTATAVGATFTAP